MMESGNWGVKTLWWKVKHSGKTSLKVEIVRC